MIDAFGALAHTCTWDFRKSSEDVGHGPERSYVMPDD